MAKVQSLRSQPASGWNAHEAAEGEVAGVAASVIGSAAGVVGHGQRVFVRVAGRVELGGGVAALEGRAAQRPLPALHARPAVEHAAPLRRQQPRAWEGGAATRRRIAAVLGALELLGGARHVPGADRATTTSNTTM